ncbi:hypothetical protein [Plantactinospora sp. KBS50]|uniref:hypothetical protein n=1 Tax=Plantactinospora sp. KBS50 TaxID=2024580 RepID=UPI000BAAED03|nr:hypothetical protein [Plantactinospora sp. KBS50]ASW55515.1 hypothetical protein CIK06_17050 [Plantactinospora sp. KBS50]
MSLGAIVRNTASQIAYRTTVTLRVSDPQGRTAIDPLNAAQLILEIPIIMPGQQVAVASSAGLRTDLSPAGRPDKVASFDVTLGPTLWLPPENTTLFPTVTTTYLGVDRFDGDPTSGRVRYSVTSTSCRPLVARGSFAVFLDQTGAVVGGAFDPDTTSPHCDAMDHEESLSTIHSIPTGIDEAKTVVSVYCDIATVGGGRVKPSGAPFN